MTCTNQKYWKNDPSLHVLCITLLTKFVLKKREKVWCNFFQDYLECLNIFVTLKILLCGLTYVDVLCKHTPICISSYYLQNHLSLYCVPVSFLRLFRRGLVHCAYMILEIFRGETIKNFFVQLFLHLFPFLNWKLSADPKFLFINTFIQYIHL